MFPNEDGNYKEFLKVISLRDKLLSDPKKQKDVSMKRLKIEKKLRKKFTANSDSAMNVRMGRYDLISEENLKELYTPVSNLSRAFVETYKTRKQREKEEIAREVRGSKILGTPPVTEYQHPEQSIALKPLENIINLNQFIQQFQNKDNHSIESEGEEQKQQEQQKDAQSQIQLLQNMIQIQNQQQAQLDQQQQRLLQGQSSDNQGMQMPMPMHMQPPPHTMMFNYQALEQIQYSLAMQQQHAYVSPLPPNSTPPPPPPPPQLQPHSSTSVNMPIPNLAGYIPPHPMRKQQQQGSNSNNRAYYPSAKQQQNTGSVVLEY